MGYPSLLMGKQYNKVIKRKRRKAYVARKSERDQQLAAKAAKK